MQVCDAYYAHGGFGIYTDFSTQQENGFFMSCDFSSCDVHFTVLDLMSTVSCVSSLMSLACSWTPVDSLDDVCNSFHGCHGFAVQLVDSFSLLCFWDVLATCCT